MGDFRLPDSFSTGTGEERRQNVGLFNVRGQLWRAVGRGVSSQPPPEIEDECSKLKSGKFDVPGSTNELTKFFRINGLEQVTFY